MTPNEFMEVFNAKRKHQRESREVADMLNARLCEIIAKCAGNTDVKLADFLIFPPEVSEPEKRAEPDQLADRLKQLTIAMGGTVINRA